MKQEGRRSHLRTADIRTSGGRVCLIHEAAELTLAVQDFAYRDPGRVTRLRRSQVVRLARELGMWLDGQPPPRNRRSRK